ncbi:MAG: sigma-E factor negative regulatory protein [Burkholderiaceae bacterium]
MNSDTPADKSPDMPTNMPDWQALSALADGELSRPELARSLAMLEREEVRARWHSYHLIGDTLRSAELAQSQDDAAFLARFRVALAAEPQRPVASGGDSVAVSIAPDSEALPEGNVLATGQFDIKNQPEAANSAWRGLALAASVVAAAAVGWNLLGLGAAGSNPAAVLAQSPGAAPVSLASANPFAPVMLRDARLDELLAAHKQLGGTSALQMPAGFLRNATFEASAATAGQ